MNTRFIKKRSALLNNAAVVIGLSLSSMLTVPVSADDNIIADDCFLYGVHDAGLNDSQIIGIKGTHSYAIGKLYPGYDIEGLDISPDGQLYGSSGDDADEGHPAGHLYKVDPSKADSPDEFITSVGDIQIHFSHYPDAPVEMVKDKEVSALSFRPDGTLWGWVEECGLVEIDKDTGYAELHFLSPSYDICVYADPSSYTSHIEDITWNNTGDIIYAVEQDRIWAYHFDNGSIELASQLELAHSVEAIEMLPDNTLLIGLNGSTLLGNLDLETDEMVTTKLKANIFYDIEALAWSCPVGLDGQLPIITETEKCGTDWHYTVDSVNDSSGDSPETSSILVGNTYYEVYGAAVKLDEDTVTIAINSRLPLGGVNSGIAWSDFFVNFGGKLYGVRFDNKNDTTYPVGLYEVSQASSLTKSNHGHDTFSSYDSYIRNRGGLPTLGGLPIVDNGYFRNTDQMPTTIKTGVKVADIQLLDTSALAAKGLDFATNLGLAPSRYNPATPFSSTNKKPVNELGEYTIGFSFPRQAGMTDAFIAYVFTECGNDGVAMVSTLPSCVVEEEPTPPVVEEPAPPVEEPTPPVVEEPAPPIEEPTPPVVEEPPPPVEEPTPPVEDCTTDSTATDANNNVTITVVDSKKVDYTSVFDIALVEHTGNTWTYKVDYVKGHALSHWDLLIPSCIGHFTNSTSGAEIGKDGSIKDRDATGIKWNTTGGTFSFTLDANYPAAATEILTKTATDYATDMITGPNCDAAPVVSAPTTCGSPADESIDDTAPVVEEPAPPIEEPTPPVVEEEAIIAEQCGADWYYVVDPINDSSGDSPETTKNLVGNSYYEVYGAAIKLEDETVTIAVNTRLPMGGDGHYSTVAWSDLFIDFGGKIYGVRFDSKNDTKYPVGLYEVSKTASLTKSNYGYANFTKYESHIRKEGGSPSLGDLPILNNGYFRNGDPMPTTIKTGVKVADIQLLDTAALTAKGLDFATNLGLAPSRYTPSNPYSPTNKKPANELGEYTFGFSFPRQAGMDGDFIAYVFTECGNDGVAMVSALPSCN